MRKPLKSSEALAISYLESQGYKIVDLHRKVVIGGVEVSDVDIVAEREGSLYAVEVKAGSVDVEAVRQAYVNAKLLDMKPMIVGRGLADEKAGAVAAELGVELNLLPDVIAVSVNELRDAVYEAVYSAMSEVLYYVTLCDQLSEEELRQLRVVAGSSSLAEASKRAGAEEREVVQMIASLTEKGILPRGAPWRSLSLIARALLAVCSCRKG
ncbi:MAG: YraN family protein [Acidilobaceae archaeon]|nr:YraN family protein [Acidilobaceae archaeon]